MMMAHKLLCACAKVGPWLPVPRVSHLHRQPADLLQAAEVRAERVFFHLREEGNVRRYLRQDMVAAKDHLRRGVVEAQMTRGVAGSLDGFVHAVSEAHRP